MIEKTDDFIKHTDNLWTLTADWQDTPFRRRMTVMKNSRGGLIIHSAIDLPDAQWRELEAFGPIEAIVIPNTFHDSEAPIYANRFPSAEVFAPQAILKKTQSRCPKSKVLCSEEEWNSSRHGEEIVCIPIEGVRIAAESVFIHTLSSTLVICDMAFNMDPSKFTGFEKSLMKWNRIGSGFGPSRLAEHFFIRDKALASRSFQKIAGHPFERIIVNHGEIIENDAKAQFLNGFRDFI